MTRYEFLLIELRASIARYLVDTEEDASLVLRRINRDFRQSDWQSLMNEKREERNRVESNREKHREIHAANRDARIVYAQCQRAKNAGAVHDLTTDQWKAAIRYFNGLCAYCQEKPYEVLEHFLSIPLGGTTAENCVPACQLCNNRKNNHAPSELVNYFPQKNIDRINEFLAMQKTDGKTP